MSRSAPAVPSVHPGLALLGVLLVGLTLERFLPLDLPLFGSVLVRALGCALAAAAMGLGLWAGRCLHTADTPVGPGQTARRLVRTGPFRLTRNPMYLAQVALLAGLGLAAFPWLLAGALVELLILDRLVVPREERSLETAFGEEFGAYGKRVGRWI